MNFGEFRRQIEYKAKLYNRTVLYVDRWFPSSKRCSCCGKKNEKLTLNDRIFICPHCGKVIDRDLNAAINIKNIGIKALGVNNAIRTLSDEVTSCDEVFKIN